ncbi:MAG: WD40 repeat domain-containing protein [Pirellulales bacterium]
MFDPAQIKSLAVYNHPETFYGLCVDHAAGKVYAGSSDYGIHVFDLAAEKKEPVARWPGHDNYVSALVFVDRPAGKWVISGGYDRRLIWWNAESGEIVRQVEAHAGWIRDIKLVPGTGLLATVGDDMLVKLWDVETGAAVRTLEGHAQRTPQGFVTALYVVAPSTDGQFLATGDRIGEVRVWETFTGTLAQSFQVPLLYTYDPVQRKRSIGGIRAVAFSPDGTRVAAGGINQINNVDGLQAPLHVELWDWRQPNRLAAFSAEGHQAIINDLAFHPSEPWLAGAGGGSNNGVLACWKVDALPDPPPEADREKPWPTTNGPKQVLEGHIHRLAFDADWTSIYAAGYRKLEVFGMG